MQPHKIDAVEAYGLGKFDPQKSWKEMSGELIEFIESTAEHPVIGLGHSLGAVFTLLAAAQRPELFSQIIIMDPPIFEWKRRMGIRLLRTLGMKGKLGPTQAALRRRNNFKSKKEALEYFTPKKLFENFHPKSLQDYVEFGLKEKGNGEGFELLIPPKVEFDFFSNVIGHLGTAAKKVKGTFVYSGQYQVLRKIDILWLKNNFPNMTFVEAKGGHMFPLELPEETAALVEKILSLKS